MSEERVPHAHEVARAEAARSPGDVVSTLRSALEALQVSTDAAAARLKVIWNPETRRYEPREEMVVLHKVVNQNVLAAMRLRRVIRDLTSTLTIADTKEA
jgi:hypothetical protein